MEQLRHLYFNYLFLDNTGKGLKLHTLTNLQTLWHLHVRDWESEVELEKLSRSLQKLGISDITSESQLDAVFRSPCMTSGNLVNLWLHCDYGVELKSTEPLYKHCQCLRKLRLSSKIREDYALQFPPSLVKLELWSSGLELHDPMVVAGRLVQLKHLQLGYAYKGAEMTCNADSFPQLEVLHIQGLVNLEEWRVEEGAMPRLKNLSICTCSKLKRLPEELKYIPSLQHLTLEYLSTSFFHRLFKRGEKKMYQYRVGAGAVDDGGERGEDFHIIQHIPHVEFTN
ncbi:hypothetical protein Ancab_039604 [Ancistrocladus abbreviatus]